MMSSCGGFSTVMMIGTGSVAGAGGVIMLFGPVLVGLFLVILALALSGQFVSVALCGALQW